MGELFSAQFTDDAWREFRLHRERHHVTQRQFHLLVIEAVLEVLSFSPPEDADHCHCEEFDDVAISPVAERLSDPAFTALARQSSGV
ncbi:MAG: hypothetical protein J4N63_10925 [Chloroflexi bacterium]|nr:hypothetical protein [Chloroflexota bacterium]